MIHACVGEHNDGRAHEFLGHHALVFRMQRHALHHSGLRPILCGAAKKRDLLTDVDRAIFAIFLLRAVGENPDGLCAGGFCPGAHARFAQNSSQQAGDAGFSPRAVDQYAHRDRPQRAPVQDFFRYARQQQQGGCEQDYDDCKILHIILQKASPEGAPWGRREKLLL